LLVFRRVTGVSPFASAASALLGALGCLALSGALLDGSEVLRVALSCGGGAAIGLTVAILTLGWARVIGDVGVARLLTVATGCLVVGVAADAAFSLVTSGEVACLVSALLLLLSGGCLALCGLRSADFSAEEDAGAFLPILVGERHARAWASASRGPSTAQMFGALWVPLAGVLLAAFIVGLTWDPVAALEEARRNDAYMALARFGGAAVAAAGLFALARRAGTAGALEALVRVVLPVSVAIVLVVPSLRIQYLGTAAQMACDALSTVGFGALTVVAFVCLVSAARAVRVSVSSAVAVLLAALATAEAAGAVAIGAWGGAGRTICLVVEGAYLAAIAVWFALPAVTGGRTAAAETPARGGSDERDLDARCLQLAKGRGLSAREAQVLPYLGRGYGAAHIGSELGISENTVRTHVRHIYEKVGVATRDELIGLLDGLLEAEKPRGSSPAA
jgi:DNA-binding CsgD family transcriptional regulator